MTLILSRQDLLEPNHPAHRIGLNLSSFKVGVRNLFDRMTNIWFRQDDGALYCLKSRRGPSGILVKSTSPSALEQLLA